MTVRAKFRSWHAILLLSALAGLAANSTGCSRAHYREQADAEVKDLIEEKAQNPHWCIQNYSIKIDPRSRMYSPFNPDRPPMPGDDAASHQFMLCVDGHKGYQGWGYNGTVDQVQNGDYVNYLPLNDEGVLVLTADQSMELALLNSSDYQEALESMYLAALDVSAERFAFDTQFFAGYGADVTQSGRLAPGNGGRSRTNVTTNTRNVQARKAYTTGANLVVGLANSLVWQLSGPDSHTASTILDFTLLQPLLRNAGRDRIMEQLTLAERSLLANVRQMQRFRRGFYMDLITGSGGQQAPARVGGFFGQSGLGGFTGVGGGGFGGVGNATFGVGAGGGAGAGNVGGYLGLLQTQQNIRNQEANISALRSSLAQLEKFREAGRIDFFQVEQIRQTLFQQTSALLTAKRGYQDTLDGFKSDLGVSPQIPTLINDRLLDQFNLIDPEILPVQNGISRLQTDAGRNILELLPPAGGEKPTPFQWSADLAQQLAKLRATMIAAEQLHARLSKENVGRALADIARLREVIPKRKEASERLRDLLANVNIESIATEREVDPSLFETKYLDPLPGELTQSATDIQLRLDGNSAKMARLIKTLDLLVEQGPTMNRAMLNEQLRSRVIEPLPGVLTDMTSDALELSLVQASARAESVLLVPVELDPGTGLEIARQFRRDWMNARASLVDAWRRIEFLADDLESTLDVVFSGDIRNTGDNPLRLRPEAGNLRVGLQWDAPLTRLQERNLYRQSLIEYQQARRQYYQTEDAISAQLRGILRQVDLNQINFEIRRTALRVAVKQVISARLELETPPRQDVGGQTATLGPTTAINLINALDSLRQAQDNFLSVWVVFEVQRGLLDLGLGTMELTCDGLWVDPGPIGMRYGYPNKPTPYKPGCIQGPDSYVVPRSNSMPPRAVPSQGTGQMPVPSQASELPPPAVTLPPPPMP